MEKFKRLFTNTLLFYLLLLISMFVVFYLRGNVFTLRAILILFSATTVFWLACLVYICWRYRKILPPI